jgi:hypothetical protein
MLVRTPASASDGNTERVRSNRGKSIQETAEVGSSVGSIHSILNKDGHALPLTTFGSKNAKSWSKSDLPSKT